MKQLGLFDAWDPLAHDCGVRRSRRGPEGCFVVLLQREGGARRADLHAPDVHAGVERLDRRTLEPRFARMLCRVHARFDGSPVPYVGPHATIWTSTGPWGLDLIFHGPFDRRAHLLHERPIRKNVHSAAR